MLIGTRRFLVSIIFFFCLFLFLLKLLLYICRLLWNVFTCIHMYIRMCITERENSHRSNSAHLFERCFLFLSAMSRLLWLYIDLEMWINSSIQKLLTLCQDLSREPAKSFFLKPFTKSFNKSILLRGAFQVTQTGNPKMQIIRMMHASGKHQPGGL